MICAPRFQSESKSQTPTKIGSEARLHLSRVFYMFANTPFSRVRFRWNACKKHYLVSIGLPNPLYPPPHAYTHMWKLCLSSLPGESSVFNSGSLLPPLSGKSSVFNSDSRLPPPQSCLPPPPPQPHTHSHIHIHIYACASIFTPPQWVGSSLDRWRALTADAPRPAPPANWINH